MPAESPSNAPHEFVERWIAEFPKHHDDRPYASIKGRDHKAAMELLKLMPAERLIKGAITAWANSEGFYCKQAATIHGFHHAFNNIYDELKTIKTKKKNDSLNM